MDPYEILGLTYPSSKEEIKARYHELAKKHHPDKLQHLPQEERDTHEETFKKINVAYELLSKHDFQCDKQEWKGVWSSVESFMNQYTSLSDIFVRVFEIAKEYKKSKSSDHYITVDVTLEEVHQRKDKKLRLFLKNHPNPVFITVDAGCYPSYLYTYLSPEQTTLFIYVTFNLQYHPIYSLDTIFNTYELYTQIELTWLEYLTGTTKTLPYLDNTPLQITIPPFHAKELILENKGLFSRDHLTISLKIKPPNETQFLKLEELKRKKFLKNLRIILE
jgi:DnaJ-class molecular chaperone